MLESKTQQRLENNIKFAHKEIGFGGVECIKHTQLNSVVGFIFFNIKEEMSDISTSGYPM
jgi:hypothetical protein